MDNFYPFAGNPDDYANSPDKSLPLAKELAWDFKKDDYIVENGEFKIVEGKEAIKIWIYFAIMTNRYENIIYSWDYGTELITLVGQKFTKGLTESEAFRFVKEALLINPYITDVINRNITFENNVVDMKITVVTIYGEVKLNVRR